MNLESKQQLNQIQHSVQHLFNQKCYTEALKEIDLGIQYAIELNDSSILSELYTIQGEIRHNIMEYTRSLISLQSALRYKINNTRACFLAGLINNKLNNYSDAEIYFTKAIESNPEYALAYSERAIVRSVLGKMAASRADAIKAGELMNNSSQNKIKSLIHKLQTNNKIQSNNTQNTHGL